MATLRLIEENEFRTSRFGQLADQVEGNLSDIIAQAEAYIERKLDRRLAQETYVEVFAPARNTVFPRNLGHPMAGEVTAVRVRDDHHADWEAVDLGGLEIDYLGGFVRDPHAEWEAREVEVTYEAGWTKAEMPHDIKAAVILQTALFAYQDLEIYGVGDSKAPGITYMQDDLKMILCPWKRRFRL